MEGNPGSVLRGNQHHDIRKLSTPAALCRVQAPKCRTDELVNAIANGQQQKVFDDLLRRLTDHQLDMLARDMAATLQPCQAMAAQEAQALIEKAIDEQSQQVWRLATCAIQGFKKEVVEKSNLSIIVQALDALIAHDANSASGLSVHAEATLTSAKAALVAEMLKDSASGVLDVQRIADLMGRGPGLYTVAKKILSPFSEP